MVHESLEKNIVFPSRMHSVNIYLYLHSTLPSFEPSFVIQEKFFESFGIENLRLTLFHFPVFINYTYDFIKKIRSVSEGKIRIKSHSRSHLIT